VLFVDERMVEYAGGPIEPWPLEAQSAIVTELKRAWLRLELRGRRDFMRPTMEALFAEMAKTAAERHALWAECAAPFVARTAVP
jgi:hypothetical protein